MKDIRAIGFDLFNTLIFAKEGALREATSRLTDSLIQNGLDFEPHRFRDLYTDAVKRHLLNAQKTGIETHNRFWISDALRRMGIRLNPFHRIISDAVDAYFSAFFIYCTPIPSAIEILQELRSKFSLGLLTNFTDPYVARQLIERLGLYNLFDVIIISGQIGYRKPHPITFRYLIDLLKVDETQILFVGDDLGPDIMGAQRSGIQPVWMTYVIDNNIPSQIPRSDPNDFPNLAHLPRVSQLDDLITLIEEISSGKETH